MRLSEPIHSTSPQCLYRLAVLDFVISNPNWNSGTTAHLNDPAPTFFSHRSLWSEFRIMYVHLATSLYLISIVKRYDSREPGLWMVNARAQCTSWVKVFNVFSYADVYILVAAFCPAQLSPRLLLRARYRKLSSQYLQISSTMLDF